MSAAPSPTPAATPVSDDTPYVSVFAKSGGFESTSAKFTRKLSESPLVPVGAWRAATVAAAAVAAAAVRSPRSGPAHLARALQVL